MRYCKYILLTISVVLGLFACQKDEDVTIAQLNIKNEVITPSYTSADIECWIECNVKFNQAKVECALTQDFQSPIVVAMEQSKGKYVAQVVDLQYDTTYYVRYIISNRMSAMTYDKIKSFKTLKPSVPTVQLDSVANIWDVTANACAQIIKDGGLPVTEWGICLKVSTEADSLFMKADSQSLSQQIVCAGLQPNTTYRVRAYAKNAVGTGYSEERTFTTFALPMVETKDVSNIKLTTALLSGMLVFNGNDSATVKGFCWGLKTNPTIDGNRNQVVVDTVGNAYTYLLSNLKDETKYYVRAYARNKIGVTYGEEKMFTTQAAVVPVVSTTAASSITSVSAKVGGNVTADGGAEVTERGICYSTTKNPTTASTKLASGKGMGSYVCDLTGLQANTTYYVRAYAVNKKGTAYGEEISFTTNKDVVVPTVTTTAASVITISSAKVGGKVIADGGAEVTERGVVYSTSQNPTTASTKHPSDKGTGSFVCDITGLQASTTYYVRAYAINEKGTAYGEQVSFKTLTPIVPPTVTTSAVTQITETTAVAGGNVTVDGGASVTERGVVYSTTANPTTANTKKVSGSGTGAFTCNLTGLQASTTYYVRAYAINEKGTAYGEQVTFKTLTPIVPPTITTSAVTQITETTAVAGGNVTADGGASVTERGVVYSTTANPTTANTKKVSGSGTGAFTCNLTGLQASTIYYVRAYAINEKGTAYGEEVTFKTLEEVSATPEYVDLGLSVKWADRNVGASKPEEYGDYFAWGETQPKSTYDWSTYKWCNGSKTTLTKYNNSSSYGIVDNKTQLELSDDAARANWGGSWRMPTEAEQEELRANCTWTWTTQNGVKGYKVTSKKSGYTNKSIFLPAAGFLYDSSLGYASSNGSYWSSSLSKANSSSSCSMGFSSSDVTWGHNYRYYGRSVRPVYGEYVPEINLPVITTSTITQIAETTAVAGGNVTADGGASVTERGVVYSTTANPTTANTKKVSGSGTGAFTCNLTGLQASTTYYVRAYAINEKGTSYGEQVTFKTLTPIVPPTVTTSAVTQITETTAVAGGNVTADGGASVTERGVVYSTSQNPTTANTKKVSGSGTGAFTCNLTGLQASTTYYVRAYAINEKGTAYGEQVTFKTLTPIVPPTVTTSAVTQITETTAVAGGNVTSDGGASVTERGVVYSTSQNPTTANTKKVLGSGTGAFAYDLTGLQASTTYYVRAYAINEKGTSYGEQVTFKTLTPIVPPTVTTSAVTQITETTAVAGGNVTADGGASVTERGVVYSTTANPTTANTKKVLGSGTGAFTCNLTGLQASTTYYVRAYAINEKGTAYGEQVTFKTLTPIVPPTVTTSAVTQITETTAVAGGNVTADGGASVTERGVVYSTTANPTTANTKKVSGSGTGAFTCNMSGLLAGTTYYVRAYAINEKGTSYGEEVSFVTKNLSSSIYVPTNEELWEIFKPYYNTYYDLWRADQPIGMVSTFAGLKMLEIMTDSESGFKWLGDYIMQVSADQGYTLTTDPAADGMEALWRWHVHSFFNCNQKNSYPFSADFTIAGQPAAWGAAYQAAYNEGRTVTIILETSSVTEYTETTAVVDCEIIYSSDMTITERGVVYGTIQKPTISNSKVTSGSGTGSFTCNLTGLQAGPMYYVRSYAINEKGIAYGRQRSFTTKAEVATGTENGYEYVDLGLSVKWATVNVGANKPEEYGDYFAWGETEPKEVYDWSTYKWCNGSATTLTKYCTADSCGTVDNKTQLELSDDAARVNWGGSWRMPTHAEQDELRNNCTWTWTTQNGVNGYKVTSKSNGNSIFLPAAGYRYDNSLNIAGSFGIYWSSSLYTFYPYNAYYLSFYSSYVDWNYNYRYYGRSVRPVCQ